MTLRDRSQTRGWALQLRVTLLILVVLSLIATQTGGSTLLAGFGAGLVLARLREPARLEVQLSGIRRGVLRPGVLRSPWLRARPPGARRRSVGNRAGLRDGGGRSGHSPGRGPSRGASAVERVRPCRRRPARPAGRGASLGLGTGALSPALAAAIVLSGCLTVLPASIGTRRLADALAAPRPETPAAAPRRAENRHEVAV